MNKINQDYGLMEILEEMLREAVVAVYYNDDKHTTFCTLANGGCVEISDSDVIKFMFDKMAQQQKLRIDKLYSESNLIGRNPVSIFIKPLYDKDDDINDVRITITKNRGGVKKWFKWKR